MTQFKRDMGAVSPLTECPSLLGTLQQIYIHNRRLTPSPVGGEVWGWAGTGQSA